MEQQNWTEICIKVRTQDLDTASNIVNMVVPYGIYIEDYSDLETVALEICSSAMIEDELINKDRDHGKIHVYIDPNENPLEASSFIETQLKNNNISYKINIANCAKEDWINNWKQYFHPMPIGRTLLIRPSWENGYDANGRTVLNIDPGLAFGTGSHPTTKLCIEALEDYVKKGTTILDVGCGSGILSIAGLLLGAKEALGVDIDETAVKTANENAEKNNFFSPEFCAKHGDLSEKVSGKYDIVVANIVADIIIRFNKDVKNYLNDDAIYITGGIIDSREEEILQSFKENNFEVLERKEDNGWLVFVTKKIKQ